MYQRLFPSSAITLKATLNAGDWIIFRKPFPTTRKTIAFIALDDIVGEKLEFVGRDDGTIWLIGRKDYNASLPSLGHLAEPNEEMIKELIGRAEQSLEKLGRSWRLWVKDGLFGLRLIIPIISKVEAKDISDNKCLLEEDGRELIGAFVSWGHGSYGLTFGIGTSKLMSNF